MTVAKTNHTTLTLKMVYCFKDYDLKYIKYFKVTKHRLYDL